jgi:hypothetical protein
VEGVAAIKLVESPLQAVDEISEFAVPDERKPIIMLDWLTCSFRCGFDRVRLQARSPELLVALMERKGLEPSVPLVFRT